MRKTAEPVYRVVIADDEPMIKMDIKEILVSNGFDVVGDAPDGFEAIKLCRCLKPDLAILDIKMPLINGIKAAQVIGKEQIAGCVILLTAHSDKSMAEHAAKANVMSYLAKPVDENTLIPAIRVALHNQRNLDRISKEYKKNKKTLDNRRQVDIAKGILMDNKGMNEEDAYHYIRKVAMNKECSVAQVAEMIILAKNGKTGN